MKKMNQDQQIKKSVNRYEHQVNDVVHYTVKVLNTNEKADTAYFIIKDASLPDSMAFDFSSVKVSGIDEKDYMIGKDKQIGGLHRSHQHPLFPGKGAFLLQSVSGRTEAKLTLFVCVSFNQ